MDSALVADTVVQLEAALDDERAFAQIMKRLETEACFRQIEVAAICRQFAGGAAASIAKREAIRRIWARHNSLMDHFAKRRAQAGRSAA